MAETDGLRDDTSDRIRRASCEVFALRRQGEALVKAADVMVDQLISLAIDVRQEKEQVEWLNPPIIPVLASEEEGTDG